MGPGCHIRSIEQLSPRVWIKAFDRPWTCSVKRFPFEPSPARRSHRWPVPKTCLRALCGSSSAVVAFVFALVSWLLEMKLLFSILVIFYSTLSSCPANRFPKSRQLGSGKWLQLLWKAKPKPAKTIPSWHGALIEFCRDPSFGEPPA